LSIFYPQRWPRLNTQYGRATVVLANPEELAAEVSVEAERMLTEAVAEEAEMDMATGVEAPAAAPAASMPMATMTPGLANDGQDEAAEPIEIRTDFNPLAIFAPEVVTGSGGEAAVVVSLPDNLTRYRVMAV